MNKVIIMGRLVKDPEIKSTQNSLMAVFKIAVDRRFSKEKQADFFPIVAWGKQAEFCSKYLTKGLKVVVVGRLQTRTWDDSEGKKHYITEVFAEEFYFAESKKNSSNPSNPSNPKKEEKEENSNLEGFYPFEDEDDLPF